VTDLLASVNTKPVLAAAQVLVDHLCQTDFNEAGRQRGIPWSFKVGGCGMGLMTTSPLKKHVANPQAIR